ncbi:hypothetical protein BHM03_00017084 [Ensete ventricosum]|nr:hypothetical protein BHM03_00017084 [Ensete ventricosum]
MLELDTLSSDSADSLRAQLQLMNQQLNEVQKEFVKSKEELEESSTTRFPFVVEIQDKPIPQNFWLPTLAAFNGSFDIAAFRAQMALYDITL